jgi:hypothetical protein
MFEHEVESDNNSKDILLKMLKLPAMQRPYFPIMMEMYFSISIVRLLSLHIFIIIIIIINAISRARNNPRKVRFV